MTHWIEIEYPIPLARTRQGEVVLLTAGQLCYAFRFGELYRVLTADEFRRLHESALLFDKEPLSANPIQVDGEAVPRATRTVTLIGSLTRADLLELRILLSRAVLMITSLSRAWNDVN